MRFMLVNLRFLSPDSGPSAQTKNKTVLEDVVAAIDAVARPNGSPLSSSTTPASSIAASSSCALSPVDPAPRLTGQPLSSPILAAPLTPDSRCAASTQLATHTKEDVCSPSRGSASPKESVFASETESAMAVGAGGTVVGSKGLNEGGARESTAFTKGVFAATAAGVNGSSDGTSGKGRTFESKGVQGSNTSEETPVIAAEGELIAASEPGGIKAAVAEGGERKTEDVGHNHDSPPASMAEVRLSF